MERMIIGNYFFQGTMTAEERKKLEVDAQKWLYGAIQKAGSATGCLCRSQAALSG